MASQAKNLQTIITDAAAIDILQQEITARKQGILMFVCLLNKDELNLLLDQPAELFREFRNITNDVCNRKAECKILGYSDASTIYVILQDDHEFAERLAYEIHSRVQLYVNKIYPESYLRCWIGSIKFPQASTKKADKLISLLHYSHSTLNNKSYYFDYSDNPVDVEYLRAKNKRLNLLRLALFNKTARFVYQPIVDRSNLGIIYYECLLRVRDEAGKWVSVGPMICDAESKDLINIVDLTVVEMAIDELIRDKDTTLSINISNIGVLNHRLLTKIDNLLRKHDVAHRLIIEITETSFNQDFETTKKFIDTLHKHGCKFALDDFGSGFTSFKQLLNLPIDIIKIDGSYIRDILNNDHSKFFVEALIKLAKDLGIKTVAEFVENGEIAKFLIDINIGAMQGDFFLPASDSRIS